MIVILVFSGLFLILSVCYLINSQQQYGTWKWPTLMVILSLAATIYGGIGTYHNYHSKSNNNPSTAQQATTVNGKQQIKNQVGAEFHKASPSQIKDAQMKILRALQKQFAKIGDVSFDAKTKTYTVSVKDDNEKKALNALMQNHSLAPQIHWNDLKNALDKTSSAVNKSMKQVDSDGYTVQMKLNDNNQIIYASKNGKQSANMIGQ